MTRLVLALVAWLGIASVAPATLTPRRETPILGADVPHAVKLFAKLLSREVGPSDSSEYVLTDRTEVLLNGKVCKYAEIPANARIIRMEVAADQRTVLRIHFRTGK
jgi:hypothetical protein